MIFISNNMIFSKAYHQIRPMICLSQACSEVAIPPLSNLSANSWNEIHPAEVKKTPLTTVQCFHNIQHNKLLYIYILNICIYIYIYIVASKKYGREKSKVCHTHVCPKCRPTKSKTSKKTSRHEKIDFIDLFRHKEKRISDSSSNRLWPKIIYCGFRSKHTRFAHSLVPLVVMVIRIRKTDSKGFPTKPKASISAKEAAGAW